MYCWLIQEGKARPNLRILHFLTLFLTTVVKSLSTEILIGYMLFCLFLQSYFIIIPVIVHTTSIIIELIMS